MLLDEMHYIDLFANNWLILDDNLWRVKGNSVQQYPLVRAKVG